MPLFLINPNQFLEMGKRLAPVAEDMPFLELMVTALPIHGLQLLIIGRHGGREAEPTGQRSDENPPSGFLLVLMLFIVRDIVIGSD